MPNLQCAYLNVLKVKPSLGLKVPRLPDFSETLTKHQNSNKPMVSALKSWFAEKRSKGKSTLYHILQLVGKNVEEVTVLKAL